MTNSSDDEQWDGATEHDDSAQMDGEDQPTMRATDEQRAAARGRALAQRLAEVGESKSSDRASRRRSTAQGLSAETPRTPATGVPISGTAQESDPASTNRGMPAAARAPAASTPPAGTETTDGPPDGRSAMATPPTGVDRRLPLPASRLPDQPRGSQPPPAGPARSIAAAAAAAADAASDGAPRTTSRGMPVVGREPAPGDDQVILLDRVSSSAPTDNSPRRGEAASGGVVIVATGTDAERIRRLCHTSSLLVPVMSSLAIAHEALSVVVIGEPSPPAPDRVVHVVRPSVPDTQLVDLLRALVTGYVVADPPTAAGTDAEPRLLELAQRLAKLDDRGAVEMVTVEAITALVAADRAHCLFFDPATGALWSEALRRKVGDARRAMGGLVGWAAYTGQTLHASPAGDDPRWLKDLDDPDGKAQSRLLVQPIIGGDRRVHAVLIAARRWRHTSFTDADIERLRRFAALASPVLDGAAAGESWKRRPSATLPGPLAAAASSGGTAASRQSATVGSPARPPTNPPPLTAKRLPTNPPPLPTSSAPRSPTGPVQAIQQPRSPTGPAQAIQQPRSPTGPAHAIQQPRSPTGPAHAIQQPRSPTAPPGATRSPTDPGHLAPRSATGPAQTIQPRSPTGPAHAIQPRSPTGPAQAITTRSPSEPAQPNLPGSATGPAQPRSPTAPAIATRSPTDPGHLAPRSATGPAQTIPGRPQTGPAQTIPGRPQTGPAQAIASPTGPGAAKRPPTDPPPPAKRPSTDPGSGAPAPIGSAPLSWSGVWSATNPPAADIPASMRDDLEDSRPPRPLTKQPPATSNTGRTKVPTGERVAARRGVRSNRKVAIVAAASEHDRMKRVARTCGLELAITASTEEAPADARIVTIGQAWSPDLDPRVVYVARTSLGNDALADLLTAIASGRALAAPATVGKPTTPNEARRAQIAFTGSRSFGSALDLVAAEASAIATMRELLDADRAYFLVYNDEDGSLRSPSQMAGRGDDRRAIAGIAGWVAHTGRTVTADRATTDPRWLAPIDDPDGDPNSQLLVEAVVGADQRVLAVMIAAKRPRRPGFTELDASLAARFAALVAPPLEQLKVHVESQHLIGETPDAARDPLLPKSPIEEVIARLRALPRWAFAVAGVVLLLLIVLIARC